MPYKRLKVIIWNVFLPCIALAYIKSSQRWSSDQPCLTYKIDLYKYYHTYYQGCTHFQPKLCGVSKEEGNGVVTEKRERKCGEVRNLIFLIVDTADHYYHWVKYML